MRNLPEMSIPATWKKVSILLFILGIILLPMSAFLFWVSYSIFLDEGVINGSMLCVGLFFISFFVGIIALYKRIIHPIKLNKNGIEFTRGRQTRFIPWSEITHIKTAQMRGVRFVDLRLKSWQMKLSQAQGLEKQKLVWKNLWISQDHIRIPSIFLKMSHKDLERTINSYFENSKNL